MVEKQTVTWADALADSAEPTFRTGVVEVIRVHDEVTPFIPVVQFTGEKVDWVREKSLGEDADDFEASDDALLAVADAAIHEVAAEWERLYTRPAEWACYFGVADRTQRELCQIFSVRDNVRISAVKRVLNAVARRTWLPGGSIAGTENTFDTVPDLLDAEVFNAHRREANRLPTGKQQTHYGIEEETGIPFGFANVDAMRLWNSATVEAFVMASEDIENLEKLQRLSSGGMVPRYDFEIPGTNDVVNAPVYKGIPLLRNEFIPLETDEYEAVTRRFYAMNFTHPDSLRGITSLGNTLVKYDINREKNMLKTYEQLVHNMGRILPSLYTISQCIHSVGEEE